MYTNIGNELRAELGNELNRLDGITRTRKRDEIKEAIQKLLDGKKQAAESRKRPAEAEPAEASKTKKAKSVGMGPSGNIPPPHPRPRAPTATPWNQRPQSRGQNWKQPNFHQQQVFYAAPRPPRFR